MSKVIAKRKVNVQELLAWITEHTARPALQVCEDIELPTTDGFWPVVTHKGFLTGEVTSVDFSADGNLQFDGEFNAVVRTRTASRRATMTYEDVVVSVQMPDVNDIVLRSYCLLALRRVLSQGGACPNLDKVECKFDWVGLVDFCGTPL